MNVENLLMEATKFLKKNNIPNPRLDAEVLLANRLNLERAYLIMHWQEEVRDDVEKDFLKDIERRFSGEPVAYIINKKEFMGLDFVLNSKVLIPRPDTEILVEVVIEYLKKIPRNKQVLDIGTGSGAIAVSIANYVEDVKVLAVDIDKDALETAAENAGNILDDPEKVELILSDCFDRVPSDIKFDAIVSNPPYIDEREMKLLGENVIGYEPKTALYGGVDGLDFYRKISQQAPDKLVIGGLLAFEIGYDQGDAVEKIIRENGFSEVKTTKDLAGMDRVVTGVLS
jgi:release factor glutamine methyltransferase